jgi:hypothetical protein
MLRRSKRKGRPRRLDRLQLEQLKCRYCMGVVFSDPVRRTLSHLAPACSSWLADMATNHRQIAMLVTQ